MQSSRPAPSPLRFGRRGTARCKAPAALAHATFGEDLKLFATTFAAGFLFVAVLIG